LDLVLRSYNLFYAFEKRFSADIYLLRVEKCHSRTVRRRLVWRVPYRPLAKFAPLR
jgi:hypothetical protein